MALWSKKKTDIKISNYLTDKNISYQIEDNSIKFELCFTNSGFILYPYITIDDKNEIISFNVNINHINVKHDGYNTLNLINKQALLLKSYVTDESILVLEYRFVINDDIVNVLDKVFKDLFSLENIIDKL